MLMLLLLLTACYGPQRRQMLALLDEADSLNRAYIPLTADSAGRNLQPRLADAARFFDSHGTPNERLRAHYLLGCAYRDMGEAPQAIDCYLDAAACADTTATDCDFSRLGCVYSQMADQYYQQLLFSNDIAARRQARHYAELAGDTLWAINDLKLSASVYILQNKRDSAEAILRKAISLYNKHGYPHEGIKSSTMLMHLIVDQPSRLAELKELIDRFDSESGLFDSNHELPSSKRQFYYYKGKYFEGNNQLDSAEHYYRKIYRANMSFVSKEPMYKGLLSVFQKQHKADSIAKYAQLYCMANDSSISIKDQDITAQMSASYQYSRFQKEAVENAEKAQKRLVYIMVFLATTFAALFAIIVFRHRYLLTLRESQLAFNQLERELDKATKVYEIKCRKLQHENQQAQNMITQIKNKYDKKEKDFEQEIAIHKSKVEELKNQLNSRDKIEQFEKLGITQRVKLFVNDKQKQLSDTDRDLLLELGNDYFPEVISDLREKQKDSKLTILVCILVILNIQSKDISRLLGISFQQVSNLKKQINKTLFNNDSALGLYGNLHSHYTLINA